MLAAAILVVLGLLLGFLIFLLQADPLRRVRPLSIFICFLWGATGAVALAMIFNTHFQWEMINTASNIEELQESFFRTPVIVAPVVEELAKALPLLFFLLAIPAFLERDTNGLLLGGAAGLGFTVFEDAMYILRAEEAGGFEGMIYLLFLRTIVGGITHMVFSAVAGWGVARACRRNFLYLPLGLGLAMFLHAMHNFLVSGAEVFFWVVKVFLFLLFLFLVSRLQRDLGLARDVLNRALWVHQPAVGWTQEEMDFLERPRRWWALARKKSEYHDFLHTYVKLLQQAFLERTKPSEAQVRRLTAGRAQLRRALDLPPELDETGVS